IDKDESVLNGEVDWVYAEELGVRSNYFWSPNNKDILFLQMNENLVPTYTITDWLPTHPKVDMEKYPKAGDPNPSVRLGVVGADGGKVKWISLTKETNIYIPRFGWVRDGLLWAEVMNRAQDTMDLYFIETHSGHSRKVLTESSPDAWVNVNDDFRILKSGDRFLWSSWRDGHTHLYLDSYSSTLTPPRMSVFAVGGPCNRICESRSVADYGLTPPKYLEFKSDDGSTLYGQLLLPTESTATSKIPLIVSVYGGPAGQLVRNAWGGSTELFHELLVKHSFAVFSVDNRGTPNRGLKFS